MNRNTVWILGDQLNHGFTALAQAKPETHRVLMIESAALLGSRRWHIQRAHLVITAMRRFALELRAKGFEVDYRHARTIAHGLHEHRQLHAPDDVMVTEPNSRSGLERVARLGCRVLRSNQFLCHRSEFAEWVGTRRTTKLEDFYRWQRRRLGILMEGKGANAQPVAGRWNFDADNRRPPPKGGGNPWPSPLVSPLDDLDHEVIEQVRPFCTGDTPTGLWATTRTQALERLQHFVTHALPGFGPHEDAMTTTSWHLAHSLLSPYLNLGLLTPAEVCTAVEAEFNRGAVPMASAEGFIRQVIGWREYVWGIYWNSAPDYTTMNALEATRPLPPLFQGKAATQMRCVSQVLGEVRAHGWAHHIQRLMILGNLCLIAGVNPGALMEWMWANFVDGAEWVMVPNVIGMSQHADGGRMATKPYASGGAYIHRMSDYCKGCRFDRTKRTGVDACPFTTLYWDFLARHRERFIRNPRMAQQVHAAMRLENLLEVRRRAADVLDRLSAGAL